MFRRTGGATRENEMRNEYVRGSVGLASTGGEMREDGLRACFKEGRRQVTSAKEMYAEGDAEETTVTVERKSRREGG